MFSKPTSSPPAPATPANPPPAPQAAQAPSGAQAEAAVRSTPAPRGQKAVSLIAPDMTVEGNIAGAGEIQIDGVIKGDVRVEHVTVSDNGQVDGGIYAEAVEVRGRVSGSITAKQVRLYGACHVEGDITHEQLAMETGAFFQGRSLRLQRAASPSQAAPSGQRPETAPRPATPAPQA